MDIHEMTDVPHRLLPTISINGPIGMAFGTFTAVVGAAQAAIKPDDLNGWAIAVVGLVIFLANGAITLWSKYDASRREGHTLDKIYAANDAAIDRGEKPPYPEYLPRPPVGAEKAR